MSTAVDVSSSAQSSTDPESSERPGSMADPSLRPREDGTARQIMQLLQEIQNPQARPAPFLGENPCIPFFYRPDEHDEVKILVVWIWICFPARLRDVWRHGLLVSLVSREILILKLSIFGLCVNQLIHKNISSRCSCVSLINPCDYFTLSNVSAIDRFLTNQWWVISLVT